jgi:hypothetical protein
MGAFEAMGEIDKHIDTGHGMLDAFGLVQNCDRVTDIFYPHFINLNFSMILLALDVVHSHLPK